ncbi:AAA-like domain-containing protein [Candidatus Parabeggiatoa sp. HSG14]|uniref:AAA-like domain-containing protein n=1 Tax=Candidatus Parabeggiatoa sp. HSG14 TaxID=3055593 RepID=UPI0025A7A080|nr:AAA-like domain-containing protein [Thiotrichales bacterium HSG14]
MKKTFNIAGPCHPNKHYMLPSQERCQGLMQLIEQNQYFVIHAARQSGKTTLLLELTKQLNETGDYYALYCSLETAQGINEAKEGISAIVKTLKFKVEMNEPLSHYSFAQQADYSDFTTILLRELSQFCRQLDKPLVIFFDESDCLTNGTLITFLRQLRDGYISRNEIPFVHSIALVGLRNIRDYKSDIRNDRETLGSYSPFNIVKASKTLRNFTPDEITQLYAQHTQETGQAFSPQVIQKVYENTQGQPWLVNAIACEIVEQILEFDVSREILPTHVEQAVQTIILRRDTHIDSLMERLKEKRVQKIIEPVLIGDSQRYDLLDDDYQYVLDLGLLRETDRHIVPSNPIYGEVIIRTLSFRSQKEFDEVSVLKPSYLTNGKLDMKQLLSDFQQFWRENSEIWVNRYQYREAAPHLVMQAFLQRIVNSGGRISREIASGKRRLDLCVHYQENRYPIELKLRYRDKTYKEGQDQLADYMDKLNCAEGWLIVFDKRKTVSWEEKIFWQTKSVAKKTIHVVGC